MPRFNVLYDVRHYNGTIEVEAENEDDAQEKVMNMSISKLLTHTADVAVDVEDVEPA